MKTVVWTYSFLSHPMGGTKYIWEAASRLRAAFPDSIDKVVVVAQHGKPAVLDEFHKRGVDVELLDERSTDSAVFWGSAPMTVQRTARKLKSLVTKYQNPVFLCSMYPANWVLAEAGLPFVQLIYEPWAYFWDRQLLAASGWKIHAIGTLLRMIYGGTDVRATRQAQKLLTLSGFTAKQISEVYGRDDAVPVYEGVNTSFFTHTALSPDPWPGKRVMFHSTDFSGIKRTDVVFEAFARLAAKRDDLMLAVSTTRPNPDAQESMLARLHAHGVDAGRTVFLGTVPYPDLPRYYSRADLVLHPVVNQPMSFVVKEALACGTPVVRGNDPECDFEDGQCGYLVDPNRIDDVVAACGRILDDRALRDRLGAAGRELVMSRYDWDSVTKRIGEVLIGST
jgi:glycosyltransferase involved in cell wall biosynthesis